MKDPLTLYQEYFVDRNFERLDLFQLLAARYQIESALYPGSFVHITPSFVFPKTVYVDSDKQARKFFGAPGLSSFLGSHKTYPQDPVITFHAADYRQPLEHEKESFDLLISQYAGFVSQACKQYLKIGGILLVNDSHGDASMAWIDPDYQLSAVVQRRDGRHRIREESLESYFIPKKEQEVTKAMLERTQKGIGYQKAASSYVFRRVQ